MIFLEISPPIKFKPQYLYYLLYCRKSFKFYVQWYVVNQSQEIRSPRTRHDTHERQQMNGFLWRSSIQCILILENFMSELIFQRHLSTCPLVVGLCKLILNELIPFSTYRSMVKLAQSAVSSSHQC